MDLSGASSKGRGGHWRDLLLSCAWIWSEAGARYNPKAGWRREDYMVPVDGWGCRRAGAREMGRGELTERNGDRSAACKSCARGREMGMNRSGWYSWIGSSQIWEHILFRGPSHPPMSSNHAPLKLGWSCPISKYPSNQTHLFLLYLFWSAPQHAVALVWQIPSPNSQIWSVRCVSSVASWCNHYCSGDSVSSAFSMLWDFYLNVTHHSTIATEVCCYF